MPGEQPAIPVRGGRRNAYFVGARSFAPGIGMMEVQYSPLNHLFPFGVRMKIRKIRQANEIVPNRIDNNMVSNMITPFLFCIG